MHPLLLAHILGDFLFQPYGLVKFKEESNWGILAHVLIHYSLMMVLWFPKTLEMIVGYLFIIAVHGVIDRTKISLQKRGLSFGIGFFLDQFIHFATIVAVMTVCLNFSESPMQNFWQMTDVKVGTYIVVLFTYLIALNNIVLKQKATLSSRDLWNRALSISASFALFVFVPMLL